jgi:F-type H+-transporting ATPase subunit delta
MQALRLLLEKRRETDFNAIREEFVRLRREHGNVLYALVTSAKPLDPAMTDRLIAKLREKTGKTVEADFRVDPTLLGGIRVAYGNYVLDGSVRGSLNRVRDILKYDLLKQT